MSCFVSQASNLLLFAEGEHEKKGTHFFSFCLCRRHTIIYRRSKTDKKKKRKKEKKKKLYSVLVQVVFDDATGGIVEDPG